MPKILGIYSVLGALTVLLDLKVSITYRNVKPLLDLSVYAMHHIACGGN
jgi:hypothetical protein